MILFSHLRLLSIGLLFGLGACGQHVTSVGLDGALTILAPTEIDYLEKMPDDWIISKEFDHVATRLMRENKELYLAINGSISPFTALRPITAQLLATPFLSWEWRFMDYLESDVPFKLSIGFLDGGVEPKRWSLRRLWSPVIPKFSRLLIVEWGQSALQRGSLQVYTSGYREFPSARYIARGGRENIGYWWRETLDLSELHAKAWPSLDMRDTEIVFAGFIVDKVRSKISGHLREVRLSR